MNFSKIFIYFSVIIFLFPLVIASVEITDSCENRNTIAKLTGSEDAHVAEWDYLGYSNYICSTEVYSDNPHVCTGNNLVLKLSGNSDAHVSAPDSVGSAFGICYDTFSCVSRTNECNTDEFCVVKLSGNSDEHAYSCSSEVVNLLVCCKQTVIDLGSTSDVSADSANGGSGGGGGRGGRGSTPTSVNSNNNLNTNDAELNQVQNTTKDNMEISSFGSVSNNDNLEQQQIVGKMNFAPTYMKIAISGLGIFVLLGLGLLLFFKFRKKQEPATVNEKPN